jgi:hypothetical protein
MNARRVPSGAPAARDQHESGFTAILAALVSRIAGAKAAALVDRDGETVDYAGRLDPFSMRLAAAHWRLVLDQTAALTTLGATRWMALRAARVSFLVHALPEGYAIVVQLARAAGFVEWRRALSACVHALGREAGWPDRGRPWFHVEVETDGRRRPATLATAQGARPIEILGALAGGRPSRERAWRVRFASGVEATLVREPGGAWYSDEPVERPEGTFSR